TSRKPQSKQSRKRNGAKAFCGHSRPARRARTGSPRRVRHCVRLTFAKFEAAYAARRTSVASTRSATGVNIASQFLPGEFFVGKRWETRFTFQDPTYGTFARDYQIRITRKEKITVP